MKWKAGARMNKGIVVKVNEKSIIVVNPSHEYHRLILKEGSELGQRIYYHDEDIISREHRGLSKRGFVSIAASLVFFAMLIGALALNNGVTPTELVEEPYEIEEAVVEESSDVAVEEDQVEDSQDSLLIDLSKVATVMTIDINPSIKVSLDEENVVIGIHALNKDAKTLDFSNIDDYDGWGDMIGLAADDALEAIVTIVKNAGFINADDEIEDYVLVTTVDMEEETEDQEVADVEDDEEDEDEAKEGSLRALLEAKIAESDVLTEVNVALIKATKVELREAEGKKVPLGLLVVQGQITIDGETMKVSDYFSNKDNVAKFEEKGKVIRTEKNKDVDKIERFLDKLVDLEVDVTSIDEALKEENPDLDQIYEDVKALWALYGDEELEEDEDEDSDEGPKDKDNEKGNNGNNGNNGKGNK